MIGADPSQNSEACAGTNTVAALLAGALDRGAAEHLEVHLDACATCRQLVADLGRGLTAVGAGPGAAATGPLPQVGEHVGRFTIERVIGVGGMGVVYEAWDRALARTVAVKLLRPDIVDGELLLGEAQAMARLQHGNVAVVHDVGRFRGQLYVCMEYVAGTTLRGWLAERRRSWRAIIDAFAAAGRGLAYVHAAGLVHLDFKPDNVLIGRGGRVVVSDFGLARAHGHRGVVTGTPAYMAPEQRQGERTCARSDQYGFCVALREALAGRGPRAIGRVVARGLAPRSIDRFASMDALLAALDRACRGARAPRWLALAAVAGTALAVGLAVPHPIETITRVIERPAPARGLGFVRGGDGVAPEPAPETSAFTTPGDKARADDDAPTAAHIAASGSAATAIGEPHTAPDARTSPVSRGGAAPVLRGSSDVPPSPPLRPDAPASPPASWLDLSADCDDGGELRCTTSEPTCPPTTVAALQAGCWTCADERTCAGLGLPRACEAQASGACAKAPPACRGREVSSLHDGCWRCADPLTCLTSGAGGYPGSAHAPRCGDGSCDVGEDHRSCPADCRAHSSGGGGPPTCGNGMCEAGEDHASCPSDCCETTGSGGCVADCGNGFCEVGEDHAGCPSDCCEVGADGACKPVCGNGFCELGEDHASCAADCP